MKNPKKKYLKLLDHKYTNQMKKELDLELLSSPLKDILIKDISPKYTNFSSNTNRVNLEEILNT